MNDEQKAAAPDTSRAASKRSNGPHQVEMDGWIACAPFERLLNITIHEAAFGKSVLSMPFVFDLAQGGGLMHGGALVSLADTAVAMAIKSIVPPGTSFVTASFETRFLRPVKKGVVTATAEVQHEDGTRFRGTAHLFDDENRPLMTFASVFKVPRMDRMDTTAAVPELSPGQVRRRMAAGETFVLNVVAAWCPDCTERQRPRLPAFVKRLGAANIPFYQVTVQQEKMQFISPEHEALTYSFGGHGYPRTVLIVDGTVRSRDNVEVISREALDRLAENFIAQASSFRPAVRG